MSSKKNEAEELADERSAATIGVSFADWIECCGGNLHQRPNKYWAKDDPSPALEASR